jgi:hypothetical protein
LKLPTPTARDYKGPSLRADKDKAGACLPGALGQKSRVLSPRFVEWMMGWPLGWTQVDPDDPDPFKHRTDRLRLCGNGVVPQQAHRAIEVLWNRLSDRTGT